MSTYLLIIAVNMLVGIVVGICGVAGFLLPMFYISFLNMDVAEALTLSFAAFIVSGILGAYNYKKAGNLDLVLGIKLSLGSLIGAVLGVKLNMIIPEEHAKLLLYTVVLASGISILIKKDEDAGPSGMKDTSDGLKRIRAAFTGGNICFAVILGMTTGAICALSGAGGPILVMPLLTFMGIHVRSAVGIALFNSIFIGIPAVAGYIGQTDPGSIMPVMLTVLMAHGAGVYVGSLNAPRINHIVLKKMIGVFSVAIAIYKLI